MGVGIGDYQIALYSRLSKRLKESSPENTKQIFDSLDQFCDIASDAPFDWFLVGGVGIDMHIGKMTRFHHDLDIEVPSEKLREMLEYMGAKGYSLFKKILSTNAPQNRRLVMYKKSDELDCLPNAKSKFRLVKTNGGKIADGALYLLSYLDVSFTKEHPSGVEVGYGGKAAILPVPYTTERMVADVKGHRIRLRNPLYHAFLKMNSRDPIDRFDMKHLRALVGADQFKLLWQPRTA